MDLRKQLLVVIEAFAAARILSVARVSTMAFNHGTMHQRLVEGADITVGRLELAMQWFSDNWPDGAAWPEGIARPPRKTEAAA